MPFSSLHKCTTCSKAFGRKGDMLRHSQTVHNPNVTRVFCPYPEGISLDFSSSASSPTISWTLPNPSHRPCRSSTKVGQETNLKTHILKHLNYRWHCPVCNASYAERATLSRHEHKWSASIRAEQQEVQRTLLMRGDNWLRATSQSFATGMSGILGSAFSSLGGAQEPARDEELEAPPRRRQRDRARYRPYEARRRSLAPSPSPPPPPPQFFDAPSPQTSSTETRSSESIFNTPAPQQSIIDSPSLPAVPYFDLGLVPEELVAPNTPPTSPPTSPPCDWENLIDPRLL